MRKTDDISKKTVMVLAIIVILVSIFGTWAVLQNAPPAAVRPSGPTWGSISLYITGSDAPTQSSAGASIALGVDNGN